MKILFPDKPTSRLNLGVSDDNGASIAATSLHLLLSTFVRMKAIPATSRELEGSLNISLGNLSCTQT